MSKIYNEYKRLKSIDSSKMYLFKCGKFYIFLADDCDLINEYFVFKKVKFSNETMKCGFPMESLNDYLRVFDRQGLKIEVVEEINNYNTVEDIVRNLNLNNMTPIDALNKLYELKEICK